jgi:hypothetical protein
VPPGLALGIVASAVDRLVKYVRTVTAQASHFLLQAQPGLSHEVVIADVPQIVPMSDGARHVTARRLDCVFTDHLCVERWAFAMPIDDLRVLIRARHQDRHFPDGRGRAS